MVELNRSRYVEVLYDMPVAADLIPCSYKTLERWLRLYKEAFPPRYRLARQPHPSNNGRRFRVRVLLASEILAIREFWLRGPGRTKHTYNDLGWLAPDAQRARRPAPVLQGSGPVRDHGASGSDGEAGAAGQEGSGKAG